MPIQNGISAGHSGTGVPRQLTMNIAGSSRPMTMTTNRLRIKSSLDRIGQVESNDDLLVACIHVSTRSWFLARNAVPSRPYDSAGGESGKSIIPARREQAEEALMQ